MRPVELRSTERENRKRRFQMYAFLIVGFAMGTALTTCSYELMPPANAAEATMPVKVEIVQCGSRDELPEACYRDERSGGQLSQNDNLRIRRLPMNDRHQGTVKWFNSTKGFGFIVPDNKELNNGSDVFVHVNDLEKSGLNSLQDGQRVSFKIEEYRGKTKASWIQAER